jgi:hypothetical protein
MKVMKNIYLILAASLFITSCGPTTVVHTDSYQPEPAPVVEVSYQSFYDQLSPYGTWINYPGYGYVWMPNAGPDFRPYSSNGNWVYTDAGWTWASNYNWGWAPFHYGRWFYENGYGWLWLPGNEWAPAWVSWRGNGDYYGWAPLGPRISVDVALNSYNPPVNYWNFVPSRYMGNPGWHNYYVNESRNVTIINQTTVINNYSGTDRSRYNYAPGPDPNEVRRVSGNNFHPVQIREANTPGEQISGSQYVIYHPRVNATPAARGDAPGRPAAPAPARSEQFNNTRQSTQYSSYNQPPGNQPANNQRPVSENSTNYQAGSNSRPSNNQRPVFENQANNLPAFTPPPANAAPGQSQHTENYQAQRNQDAARQMDLRTRKQVQVPQDEKITQNNVQTKPVTANHPQNTGRPSNVHNPNNGQPVQKTVKPQQNPEQKNNEKPKTREAENNN